LEYLKLTIGSKFELLHSCWCIFYFGKVVFEFLNIPEFFLNFMGFISTFLSLFRFLVVINHFGTIFHALWHRFDAAPAIRHRGNWRRRCPLAFRHLFAAPTIGSRSGGTDSGLTQSNPSTASQPCKITS